MFVLNKNTKYQPDFSVLNFDEPCAPENQVVEAGCTPNNLAALAAYLSKSIVLACKEVGLSAGSLDRALNLEEELAYPEFMLLYDYACSTSKNGVSEVRAILPEFGYSPYNLFVIEQDLGLQQTEMAKLLGWSTPKLRQHVAANINSSHYKPMRFCDWLHVYSVYKKAVELSDKKFSVQRNTDSLFYDKERPLQDPMTPKGNSLIEQLNDLWQADEEVVFTPDKRYLLKLPVSSS